MNCAILVRDRDYQVISYPDNQDPLYGYGSWNLHSKWDTREDAEQAMDLIAIVSEFVNKEMGYKELKSII